MEKNKEISEDDLRGYMSDVQDLTDQYIDQINEQLQKKEQELLEI
jgi:ribosome recycling factor